MPVAAAAVAASAAAPFPFLELFPKCLTKVVSMGLLARVETNLWMDPFIHDRLLFRHPHKNKSQSFGSVSLICFFLLCYLQMSVLKF